MADDQNPKSDIVPKNQVSTAPRWDEQTTTVVGIGFSLLMIVLGVVFWSVIPFALTTIVIAYLLNPMTDSLEKRITLGRRGYAVLLTFVLILVIIVTVFVVLIPPLIEQSISGITSLVNTGSAFVTEPQCVFERPVIAKPESTTVVESSYMMRICNLDAIKVAEANGDEIPESLIAISIWDYIRFLSDAQGFETVSDWLLDTSRNVRLDRETIQQFFSIGGGVTTGLVGQVFSIAGSTIGFAFNTLFFLTILASLLAGGGKISETILDTVPDGYEDDARRLLRELGGVWNGYVRGNFTLGLVMGFVMWVIAIVLGLPNPLFLAFVAFLMEFIPNLGPVIAMAVAAAIALAGGSSTFPELNNIAVVGVVVVAWFIMQQLEATILVPRIVGENLNLHPAIVILSVIWGASFGGLLGVVIAPPLVASIRIILHYIYGRLTGRTSFTEPQPPPESLLTRIQQIVEWVTGKVQSQPDKKKS